MKRLMVLAGEVSGDIHASLAIKRFRELYPDLPLQMMGFGGEGMEKVGVKLFQHTSSYGKIGYLESLTSIFRLLSLLVSVKKMMREWRPHLLLLVDSPGFNLRLLPLAKELGIPALIYFGPSAWIWGEGRAKGVVREEATVAAVFKEEEELYRRIGGKVHFVGHPVVDLPLHEEVFMGLKDSLGDGLVLGLLPGSRRVEVERLLPIMLRVASTLKKEYPSLTLLLPLAPTLKEKDFHHLLKDGPEVLVVKGSSREVMALSTIIITASGTSTLEAAVLQTPMIIIYQVSPLTAFMGRRLGIKWVGMPNLLMNDTIVPEVLQEELKGDRLLREARVLLDSPLLREEMGQRLALLKERLGPPGALDRMAQLMKDFL